MAILQLTDGAATALLTPRLRVSLSCSAPAQLSLATLTSPGEQVAPVATISATSMIVDARDGLALVVAATSGAPFVEGTIAELTITGTAVGNDSVRRSLPVGGRRQAVLVEFVGDEIHAGGMQQPVGRQLTEQPWHAAGRQAYFDADRNGVGSGHPWAAVLDCSASMIAASRRPRVHQLLELIFGAAVTNSQAPPVEVLSPSGVGYRAVGSLLDEPTVDWAEVLGAVPAPWPRLTPAVRQAGALTGVDGDVLVVCDGVPADVTELVEFATRTPVARLRMLVLGRSPFEAIAADRPSAGWDDELVPLRPLHDAGHVVVSLQRPHLDEAAGGEVMRSFFRQER